MGQFFFEIAFKGSAYHGWQIQENAHTIQGVVEDALGKLFGNNPVQVTGCGRTDTGVHARKFYFSFFGEEKYERTQWIHKMNKILPCDIAVKDIHPVKDEAHVRFDAVSRTYEYWMHREKDPFSYETSHYIGNLELDIERMQKAASIIKEHEEFTSFCKSGGANATDICRVESVELEDSGKNLLFRITADRFLRNMVRAIVGTLLEIGRKGHPPEHMDRVIESKDRSMAGDSAPAHGLFLTDVVYPYLKKE